jgi:AraC-like DNA-binding protein
MHTTSTQLTPSLNALAEIIGRHTTGISDTGNHATTIPGLTFFRRETPTTPTICMVEPSIVIIVQGAKQLWLGEKAYPYDATHFLITSLNLPANGQVTTASPEQPCLGLSLKLDLRVVTELISQGTLPLQAERAVNTGVGLGTTTTGILHPFERLLALLAEPDAIPVLAPLIQREIHYRLLMSDQSARLRQIVAIDGKGHRIAKAIEWLKLNYAQPLRVDQLASSVQMSAPTFHQHFRQLTAMSPLQYQKWLRLNEAKRLMFNEHLDVSRAAFKVGYESPSQFSREYSRLFGIAPKRDIATLREQAQSTTPV